MSSNIPEKDNLATKPELLEAFSELKIRMAELRADMHRAVWTVGLSIIGTILTTIGISSSTLIRFLS